MERLGDCHGGLAVDRGMVHFQDQRKGAPRESVHVVETFDKIQFPQRAGEIKRSGMDPRGLNAELAPVTWSREGNVADVVFEFEIVIVRPPRQVEIDGDMHDFLVQWRDTPDECTDMVEQSLEADLARAGLRGRIHPDRGSVHGRVRTFRI